jgi:hypothetical protein
MSITLAVGATSVTLHEDLYWADEYAWQPVEQATERTIGGALIVQSALRTGGRPITLQPDSDNAAWLTRAVVEQLRNWAATPGQQMTLTIRGTPRTVIWRHHDAPALDATPVVHYSDAADGDYYRVTLRLMEV